jgi:hypothetical protein
MRNVEYPPSLHSSPIVWASNWYEEEAKVEATGGV